MKLSKKNIINSLALILVLAITVLVQGTSQAAISYPGPATMTLTPSSGSYAVGSTFSVTIRENSGTNEVGVVEADLAYNPSQLEFISSVVSNEFANSGLMQNSGANGLTCLVGSTMGGPVLTGNHVVTTITFKVLAAGTSNITFVKGPNACSGVSEGSEILSVANKQNIWNGLASAGSYTLTSGSTTPTTSPPTSTSTPATSTTTPKTTTATTASTAPMTNSSNPNIQQAVQGATSGGSLITVKVVDANNKIVVGAKVTLDGSSTSISDFSGYAYFKNVPTGKHTVKSVVSGKEVSQIIDVKGVSTEAQSFSIKPVSKAESNSYIKYVAIVLGILAILLVLFFLFRKFRKPKDPHMIGLPITTNTMPASPTPPSPKIENVQSSSGLPSAGAVITPNIVPEHADTGQEPDNGQT